MAWSTFGVCMNTINTMNRGNVRLRWFAQLCLVFLVAIVSRQASAAYESPLVPATFDRVYDDASLSPDGKHFALNSIVEKQSSVLIFNVESMQITSAFKTNKNQDVLRFWWANNERVVVNIAIRNALPKYPLLNGELFALNVDNTERFAVAGFSAGDKASFEFLDSFTKDTTKIRVVRSDIRNKHLELINPIVYTLDVYERYKLRTGTVVLDRRLGQKQASPFAKGGFAANHAGEVTIAYEVLPSGKLRLSYRVTEDRDWVEQNYLDIALNMAQQEGTNPVLGFNAEGTGVYILAAIGGINSTTGLYFVDFESGSVALLHSDEKIDITAKDVLFASNGEVLGVSLAAQKIELFGSHPEKAKLKGLAKLFDNQQLRILNYSDDGSTALIDVVSQSESGGLYIFRLDNNALSLLISTSDAVAAS